jgi:hypothetical protein
MNIKLALLALACSAIAAGSPEAAQSPRRLVAIIVPDHDPLFVDADTVRRNGASVSFKYILDVLAPPAQEGAKPTEWRSNEIDATIDCRRRTVVVRRLTAYSGPRATGAATAVHTFMASGLKPEPITPKSTFFYLAEHVCEGV